MSSNTKSEKNTLCAALRALRWGRASREQQLLANKFLTSELSRLGQRVVELDPEQKQHSKDWEKWQRMEFVYEAIHDPSCGGLVQGNETSSHTQAYKDAGEYFGVSPETIRRDYERLRKTVPNGDVGLLIEAEIGKLWLQVVRGK